MSDEVDWLDEVTDLDDQVDRLKADLADTRAEIAEQQACNERQRETISAQGELLAAARAEVKQQQRIYKEAIRRILAIEEVSAELRAEIERLKRELEDAYSPPIFPVPPIQS
jgi:chromosome segregation ATPase